MAGARVVPAPAPVAPVSATAARRNRGIAATDSSLHSSRGKQSGADGPPGKNPPREPPVDENSTTSRTSGSPDSQGYSCRPRGRQGAHHRPVRLRGSGQRVRTGRVRAAVGCEAPNPATDMRCWKAPRIAEACGPYRREGPPGGGTGPRAGPAPGPGGRARPTGRARRSVVPRAIDHAPVRALTKKRRTPTPARVPVPGIRSRCGRNCSSATSLAWCRSPPVSRAR